MTPRKSNVDGGYAWVVAGALFLMDLQIGMMWTIIGLLTPAIIREIGEDITLTSLVGSTFLGTTTLFGPASGLLQDKLGHRRTGMVSGVLMLLGLTSASFCKSVTGLILTFGFVTGLGASLALNVSGVAPGSYFVKKLSVAYGLIQVGGGCGMVLVGPLTIFLLDQYNLSGTLMILGGIMFHMTLAGALIRPNNVIEDKEMDIEVVTDSYASTNKTVSEFGLHSQDTNSEDRGIDIEDVTDSYASSTNMTVGKVGLHSQNTKSEDRGIDNEVVTDSYASSANGTIGEGRLDSQNTKSDDRGIANEVVIDSNCASSANETISEVGLHSQNIDSDSVVSAEDPPEWVPEDLNHSDDTERSSFKDALHPNCSVKECIALHKSTASGERLITNHKLVIEEIERLDVKEQSSKGKSNPTFSILFDSVDEDNSSFIQISDDKESNFSKSVVNPSFSTSLDSLNEESAKDKACIFMTNASCKICSEVGNELHELGTECDVSCGEGSKVKYVEINQNNQKDDNLLMCQELEKGAASAQTEPRNVKNREVLARTKSIDKENIKPNCNIFKNTLLNSILQVIKGNGFYIYLLSSVFWTLGDSSCMLHLPNYAESKGTTPTQTSTFLVGQGVSTIFSSFLSGFVVSDPAIGNTIINFGSLGMAGLVTILFPLYSNSYLFQLVYISLYGFYSQTSYTMVGPHCIQLVGTANLGLGYGLASFVTGLGFLFGPPIASLLYEVSGVYDYSFIFAGFCLLAAAFLLALIPMFEKGHEKERVK